MTPDPIVEEVRAIRDAFAKEHGHDLRAIVKAIQREEVLSGRKFAKLPIQRVPVGPENEST